MGHADRAVLVAQGSARKLRSPLADPAREQGPVSGQPKKALTQVKNDDDQQQNQFVAHPGKC